MCSHDLNDVMQREDFARNENVKDPQENVFNITDLRIKTTLVYIDAVTVSSCFPNLLNEY